MSEPCSDTNVEAVVDLMRARAARGLVKYGVPTSRAGLTERQWLEHLREELADALVYITAALNTGEGG